MMASHGAANESGPLQAEDYQQILDLMKAKDPRGAALAKTLSPDEAQQFFDFQKNANKNINPASSPDRNLMAGVPYVGSVDPADAIALGLAGAGTKAAAGKAMRGFAESPDGFW